MQDNQIREQFTEWARPLQATAPPPLAVIRRRARRRTAALAASGVTAVAAAAVLAVSLVTWLAGPPAHAPAPVSGSRYLAAALPGPDAGPASAPFFLTLDTGNHQPALVQDVKGRTLGQVLAPKGMLETRVVAAGDDRTFVLSARTAVGMTWFYEVRLSRTGRPGPLTRLDVPPLRRRQVDGLALSADGTELAVASEVQLGGARPAITVDSLATGQARTWESASGYVSNLSWAGDSELAFELDLLPSDQVAPQPGSGIRLLDTTAPGTTPLAASRLLVPDKEAVNGAAGIVAAQITPDGSALYVALQPEAG